MLNVYRNANTIVDSIPSLNCGDTMLVSIAICEDSNNLPQIFTCPDGSAAHMYSFVWYSNWNGTLLGLKYHTEIFFAHNLSDALARWYRYLRLTGTGATHDEAMEVADNLNWQYHDFEFCPKNGDTSLNPMRESSAKKKR